MADNTTLPGTGEVIRTIDKSSKKAEVVIIDLGGAGAESLLTTSMPIQDGGNTITVDGTVTLGAGTAEVGKLAAGTALIGKVGIDQATANANEVVVKSGTVTAVTSVTNAVAVTNAGITTIAGAVAGTEMQVDVLTMPTVTVNSHAVTNAGTFATQATLAAETTKVIGTVNVAASQTIAVTNATAANLKAELGASTAAIGKLAANSGVDIGDVDVLSLPGTGVEDAAETAGGVLHMVGAVRRDTCASSSGTTGDNSTINTDAVGALWVDPQGNVAHDAADAGNPIKTGAKAITNLAAATMVSAADRTDLYADLDGVQITKLYAPFGNLLSERVTNTDGAATALTTFGATADARNYITSVTICNSSAAFCTVDLRDGTAGSVIWTFPLPATGGVTHNFNPPLKQPTANTALAFDASGATTTLTLSFNGFKSKA